MNSLSIFLNALTFKEVQILQIFPALKRCIYEFVKLFVNIFDEQMQGDKWL